MGRRRTSSDPARIASEIEHLRRPVGELREDERNARVHEDVSVRAIAASLEEFGQTKPVVARADGLIIAGHGTLRAARSLGWLSIAAVTSDLDGEQADAYALVDNRTAELSSWDQQLVSDQLAALGEGGALGEVMLWSEVLGPLGEAADDDAEDEDEPDPTPAPGGRAPLAPPEVLAARVERVNFKMLLTVEEVDVVQRAIDLAGREVLALGPRETARGAAMKVVTDWYQSVGGRPESAKKSRKKGGRAAREAT